MCVKKKKKTFLRFSLSFYRVAVGALLFLWLCLLTLFMILIITDYGEVNLLSCFRSAFQIFRHGLIFVTVLPKLWMQAAVHFYKFTVYVLVGIQNILILHIVKGAIKILLHTLYITHPFFTLWASTSTITLRLSCCCSQTLQHSYNSAETWLWNILEKGNFTGLVA